VSMLQCDSSFSLLSLKGKNAPDKLLPIVI
jgi:hypothetical protein